MKYFVLIEALVVTFLITGNVSAQSEQNVDNIEALIESVQYDLTVDLELTCILPPEGTTPFVAKLTVQNAPPIRPSDPDFPSDYCLPNATLYSTATGEGVATHLGLFEYSERYCGMPGFGSSQILSSQWKREMNCMLPPWHKQAPPFYGHFRTQLSRVSSPSPEGRVVSKVQRAGRIYQPSSSERTVARYIAKYAWQNCRDPLWIEFQSDR